MPNIKARNAGSAATDLQGQSVTHKITELKSEGLSADEAEILCILEPVLLSNGTAGKEDGAPAAAAAALDGLFLAKFEAQAKRESKLKSKSALAFKGREDGGEVEGFLIQLWELLISLVSAVPHDDPAQNSVVALIEELRLRATTSLSLWGVSATSLILSFLCCDSLAMAIA